MGGLLNSEDAKQQESVESVEICDAREQRTLSNGFGPDCFPKPLCAGLPNAANKGLATAASCTVAYLHKASDNAFVDLEIQSIYRYGSGRGLDRSGAALRIPSIESLS